MDTHSGEGAKASLRTPRRLSLENAAVLANLLSFCKVNSPRSHWSSIITTSAKATSGTLRTSRMGAASEQGDNGGMSGQHETIQASFKTQASLFSNPALTLSNE